MRVIQFCILGVAAQMCKFVYVTKLPKFSQETCNGARGWLSRKLATSIAFPFWITSKALSFETNSNSWKQSPTHSGRTEDQSRLSVWLARAELCSRKVNLPADDLVKSELIEPEENTYILCYERNKSKWVTKLVSKLYGKPFQTYFCLSFSVFCHVGSCYSF